jgi:tetratricopeptide (TPR) repeat protein
MAIEEAPNRREAYVELASLYYYRQQWESCYKAVNGALAISEKPLEYLVEEFAWGPLPYDLGAIALYNMGNYQLAYDFGERAYNLDPASDRLKENLEKYRAALA